MSVWDARGAEDAWKLWRAEYFAVVGRPAPERCYRKVRLVARTCGWTIPSLGAFRRRLQREALPEAGP